MKNYIAFFSSKAPTATIVRFQNSSKELAQAAAHRYARDNVLHLDRVTRIWSTA